MDAGNDPLIGGSTEGSAPTGGESSAQWPQLFRREAQALSSAQSEALEIARALAVESMTSDRDAVMAEFEERLAHLSQTAWPDGDPLAGYGLHGSIASYVIARVAIAWVPSGHTGLRHEPLRREALVRSLVEQGIDESVVLALLGDWEGPDLDFKGSVEGLSPSLLAGLSERSLTRKERNQALNQVAKSPRDLARLASTLSLLAVVRGLLPLLPPDQVGSEFLVGLGALVLGRPDRVQELLADAPDNLAIHTLKELASAQWALGQGELPQLQDDSLVRIVPTEETISAPEFDSSAAEATQVGPAPEGDDDEDDVLEIVEEQLDSSSQPPPAPLASHPLPARWQEAPELSEEELSAYQEQLRSLRGLVATRGYLLGLKPLAPSPVVQPRMIPPDEAVLGGAAESEAQNDAAEPTERIELEKIQRPGPELSYPMLDPLFPGIRGVLRAVVAASGGRTPSPEALEKAGDLAWVLKRASVLAHLVRGRPEQAISAGPGLDRNSAPELRWAEDYLARFAGRAAPAVDAEQARPAAAALLADVVQQLARTLAGTVPSS